MTRYLIKAGRAVRDFYNDMNGANLTGAIDVIVVRQKDGSLVGTPIHAHFGKLGVLRSREKEVELCVNGKVIDYLDIRLNEWGTATIYENHSGNNSSCEDSLEYKQNINGNILTNNIGNGEFALDHTFKYKENIVEKNLGEIGDVFVLDSNEGIFPLEDIYPEDIQPDYRDVRTPSIISFQSTTSSFGGRRHSFSESELFESTDEEMLPENAWIWKHNTDENFEFTSIENSKDCEDPTLFPPNNDGILDRMKRLLLRPSSTPSTPVPMSFSPDPNPIMSHTPIPDMSLVPSVSKPVDISSDLGSSPETSHTVSPSSSPPLRNPFGIFSNCQTPVAMSLCGGLNFDKDIEQEMFEKHLVSFEKFANCPEILSDPNLVVRINGKYYNWRVAAPILMSRICFNEPLPTENIAKLSEGQKQSRIRSWFTWSKKSDSINMSNDQKSFSTESPHPIDEPINNISVSLDQIEPLETCKHESELLHDNATNVLTSEQLASLPLREGPNEVSLSVATRYQGTCRVDCTLHLWNYNDKIVVSDIDGTITKSDALGQILPILGKDWSHKGVTDLYRKIGANGYKFIYLSARAIGQSTPTRTMLQNIKQQNITLPDGPLLLAPLSLFGAFHQEMIAKKPDVFKIRCLEEVKRIFPCGSNPFFAGYGNRQTDVKSYEAIGIPKSRIFIINTKGQLRHQQALSFRSSYTKLTEYVDYVYPHLGGCLDNNFSDYLYWKQDEYGSDWCDEFLEGLETT